MKIAQMGYNDLEKLIPELYRIIGEIKVQLKMPG